MRRPGCAFCAAAVASSVASTRLSARSLSPGRVKVTSAERPSLENWPSCVYGDLTLVTCGVRFSRAVTSVHGGLELRVRHLALTARLNQHRLVGAVGEVRGGDRLVGDPGGAVAGVLVGELLRADGVADREGDDDEREPSEDGGLAVPGAPVSGARGEVPLGHCGPPRRTFGSPRRLPGGTRLVGRVPRRLGMGSPTGGPVGLAIVRALLQNDDQDDDDEQQRAQSDVHGPLLTQV